MSEITHQLLTITPEQKEALRDIALFYGFTIGRGKEKTWGSINQLAAAIADGKLMVIEPPQRAPRNTATAQD